MSTSFPAHPGKLNRTPLGLSRVLRDVPVDRYRLPDDGRKWRILARDRQSLAEWLGTFADADGSRIFPAVTSMQKHFGWSSGKTYRVLDDLKKLGVLESTGKLSGPHGTRVRKMNVEAFLRKTNATALADLHDSTQLTSTIRSLTSIPGVERTVTRPSSDLIKPAERPGGPSSQLKEIEDRRKITAMNQRLAMEAKSIPRTQVDRERQADNARVDREREEKNQIDDFIATARSEGLAQTKPELMAAVRSLAAGKAMS